MHTETRFMKLSVHCYVFHVSYNVFHRCACASRFSTFLNQEKSKENILVSTWKLKYLPKIQVEDFLNIASHSQSWFFQELVDGREVSDLWYVINSHFSTCTLHFPFLIGISSQRKNILFLLLRGNIPRYLLLFLLIFLWCTDGVGVFHQPLNQPQLLWLLWADNLTLTFGFVKAPRNLGNLRDKYAKFLAERIPKPMSFVLGTKVPPPPQAFFLSFRYN
jgi:hypothetical protein